MPIYMKITKNGKLVTKGDAKARGHENWIELSAAQIGEFSSRPNTSKALHIKEIVITKAMDPASTKLFQESLLTGEGLTVQIDFVKSSKKGAPPMTYLGYTLDDTRVADYKVVNGSETIKLSFTKALINKQASDPDEGDIVVEPRWTVKRL